MCFLPNVSVAGVRERLLIVWIFLLLKYLSDRRGPAALGRGEVRTSAGRDVSETRLCAAPTRGNPRSEVPPPEAAITAKM